MDEVGVADDAGGGVDVVEVVLSGPELVDIADTIRRVLKGVPVVVTGLRRGGIGN